jgi:hypothetical protein
LDARAGGSSFWTRELYIKRAAPPKISARRLAAEVREKPKEQRQAEAENEACHDGKIKRGVFTAMDDVAGEFSETKRKFGTEIEESADQHEDATEDQQHTTKFAERIHTSII